MDDREGSAGELRAERDVLAKVAVRDERLHERQSRHDERQISEKKNRAKACRREKSE